MLFEDLLLLLSFGVGIFFIGIPMFKLINSKIPKKIDNLAEAKKRLEQARMDAEAAKLNKEAEQVYQTIYEDVLEDESSEKDKRKL
jgi:hypothetical protein